MPGDNCCSICLSDYEDDKDAVSVNCKHIFHRQCIVKWLKSQLMEQISARTDGEGKLEGNCPCCRTPLLYATSVGAPYILAHTWVQSLYGLEGTMFQDAGRAALRCIAAKGEGGLTLALVDDVVHEMIQKHRDYEQIARKLGVLYMTGPRLSIPAALYQYQVNVATADYSYAHRTIYGDIASLRIIVTQLVPPSASVYDGTFEWAPVIDQIFERWQANNYPRCNYITLPALHRLVICACLVSAIAQMGHSDTVAYGHLLAHGERLMLDMQQQLDSGNLSETHVIEYHRVLNYTDNGQAGPISSRDRCLYFMSNIERIHWITDLRQRTRGRNLV